MHHSRLLSLRTVCVVLQRLHPPRDRTTARRSSYPLLPAQLPQPASRSSSSTRQDTPSPISLQWVIASVFVISRAGSACSLTSLSHRRQRVNPDRSLPRKPTEWVLARFVGNRPGQRPESHPIGS